MSDILFSHATIITMNPNRDILEDSAIVVSNGRILDIGPSIDIEQKYPSFQQHNCHRRIILPGLIDCHGHAGHSMLGILGTDTLSYWGQAAVKIYFHYCSEDFWYFDGLLGALARLRYGVTTGISVMGCEPRSDDPIFSVNHARGYAEVGVREAVCVGPRRSPWPHTFGRWKDGRLQEKKVSWEEAIEGTDEALHLVNHSHNDLVRAFVTPFTIAPSMPTWGHTPPERAYHLTEDDRKQARTIRMLADKHHTRIHSDGFGNLIRMAAQEEGTLLGPDVILQHCLGITPKECRILAETHTNVAHSQEAFWERCPYSELLEWGVNAVISTDGSAPRNNFDLLASMRRVQLLEAILHDDINYIPAGKMLEAITIDAARAMGWESEIGSLEPGKKADLLIINASRAHMMPAKMPVHNIAYQANCADIETVIIDGQVILDNGKVQTIDEEALVEASRAESEATIARAGLTALYNKPCWGKAYYEMVEPLDTSVFEYED